MAKTSSGKTLALLLTLALVFSVFPMTAFAADAADEGTLIAWGSQQVGKDAGNVLAVVGPSGDKQMTYIIDKTTPGAYHNFDIYYAGGNGSITITPKLAAGAEIESAEGESNGVSNVTVSGNKKSITASITSDSLPDNAGGPQITMTLKDSEEDETEEVYTIRVQSVARVTVTTSGSGEVYLSDGGDRQQNSNADDAAEYNAGVEAANASYVVNRTGMDGTYDERIRIVAIPAEGYNIDSFTVNSENKKSSLMDVTVGEDTFKAYYIGTSGEDLPGLHYKVAITFSTGSNSSSSGSGGSSSGGGGGGGGGTAAPQTSSNVSADGTVNSTTATNELKKALNDSSSDTAVVSVKNAESISASALQSLAKAADSAGKETVVQADTVDAQGIQARLYLEPDKLTGLKGDLKLGVETRGARPEARKALFEKHFTNKVAVVSCAQSGSFGAKLKIAAKVELPKNTANLVFYSYDAKTGKYKRIDTNYRIDKNGYIHFVTELAGDIIISDGPLKKK